MTHYGAFGGPHFDCPWRTTTMTSTVSLSHVQVVPAGAADPELQAPCLDCCLTWWGHWEGWVKDEMKVFSLIWAMCLNLPDLSDARRFWLGWSSIAALPNNWDWLFSCIRRRLHKLRITYVKHTFLMSSFCLWPSLRLNPQPSIESYHGFFLNPSCKSCSPRQAKLNKLYNDYESWTIHA